MDEFESRRIAIPLEFEEVFTHFYVAKNTSGSSVTRTLVPSFQTILVFSFGREISFVTPNGTSLTVEQCVVLGPLKQPLTYTLAHQADMLVVNFKEDAFYRFFGRLLTATPAFLHPDELLGENCFTDLWHAVKGKTTEERIQFILDFSLPYLKEQDSTLKKFLELGHTRPDLNPIKTLAQETQQSERNLQLKHKKQLGYSAKELNRYQRFFQALELVSDQIASEIPVDWYTIVALCGYYDQSQLIHDFQHYLHLSPKQFLKFQQEICSSGPA